MGPSWRGPRDRCGRDAAGRLPGLPRQHALALDLVQPSPDPVGLTDAEGVVQALLPDGAGRADGLGSSLSDVALVLALEVRRWEEDRGLGSPTGGPHLPRLLDSLNAHSSPSLRFDPTPGAPGQQGSSFKKCH